MHITLESDYAVRMVYCLARNDGRMEAKRISAETGVPLRFALKILNKLVSGEIIKSYKGKNGGYELARLASEISLRQVIEQVEGVCAFSRCVESRDFECNRNKDICCVCEFNAIFTELTDMVRERLEKIKFSEVCDKAAESSQEKDT